MTNGNFVIIDHGVWEGYKPDPRPEGAPPQAMFCRRASDGQDWYKFAWNAESWQKGSVKATVLPTSRGEIVQAVYRDPSFIYPQGCRLVEILGVDPKEEKPHGLFGQKLFDPEAGAFGELAPLPVLSVSAAQAKTALFAEGLLDIVEELVRNHPYRPVRIFFESANNWETGNAYVQAIGVDLGLITYDENGVEDATRFDALFKKASLL